MKIRTLLGTILRSLFRTPATRHYPIERTPVPERLRGELHWNSEKCTGCAVCVKDCPADAIELLDVDRANKRFILRYHADRCIFCGQCAQSCRFKCLELSSDRWELAALNRDAFSVDYGKDEDIHAFVEKLIADDASTGDQNRSSRHRANPVR